MLNDRKASELVTKSLRRALTDALTDEESDALEKNLTDSKELEAFAKLSHKIQISAVEIATLAEHGDVTIGPGLSGEAKRSIERFDLRRSKRRSTAIGRGASAGFTGT